MDMERLSALLLDLYRYAHELPIGDFQDRALRRLQTVIPFERAWWGMARIVPGQDPELHSSFPFNLPAEYSEVWEQIKRADELAQALHRSPGLTICIDAQRMRESGIARLLTEFDVAQVMSTLIASPELNLVTFLSLYRGIDQSPFGEEERRFKQSAMPHLVATWNMNWISGLEQLQAHSAPTRAANAIADRHGVLLSAEPRFLALLRREWPEWKGPELPSALASALWSRSRSHIGSAIAARCDLVADLQLLEVRARSPIDRLSRRERSVAASFAEGHSHKEVAGSLGLSPATVRHHLRRIYSKLAVSDKAALSRLLIESGTDNPHAAGVNGVLR